MKKITFLLILLTLNLMLKSQNIKYAKSLIDTLCSPSMHGRGCEFKGDSTAARFLETELKKNGLSTFKRSYLQQYTTSVNCMQGKMNVKINDKELVVGVDFLVDKNQRQQQVLYHLF